MMASDTTNDDFAALWAEALKKYKQRTGVDLGSTQVDSVQRLISCNTGDEVMRILESSPDFLGGKTKNTKWDKTKACLRDVLDVVAVLNVVVGEAANVVLPGGKAIFVATGFLFKGIKGTAEQAEELEVLFSRFSEFLSRLEVRKEANIRPGSRRIFVKILVELLNALAIATSVMKKGLNWDKVKRTFKKLLDDDEIQKAIDNLSILVDEEMAMMMAETLVSSVTGNKDITDKIGGLNVNVELLANRVLGIMNAGADTRAEIKELRLAIESKKNGDNGDNGDNTTEVERFVDLLNSENNATQDALSHIVSEMHEIKRSLAEQRNTASSRAVVPARDWDPTPTESREPMSKHTTNYGNYNNYGQQTINHGQMNNYGSIPAYGNTPYATNKGNMDDRSRSRGSNSEQTRSAPRASHRQTLPTEQHYRPLPKPATTLGPNSYREEPHQRRISPGAQTRSTIASRSNSARTPKLDSEFRKLSPHVQKQIKKLEKEVQISEEPEDLPRRVSPAMQQYIENLEREIKEGGQDERDDFGAKYDNRNYIERPRSNPSPRRMGSNTPDGNRRKKWESPDSEAWREGDSGYRSAGSSTMSRGTGRPSLESPGTEPEQIEMPEGKKQKRAEMEKWKRSEEQYRQLPMRTNTRS